MPADASEPSKPSVQLYDSQEPPTRLKSTTQGSPAQDLGRHGDEDHVVPSGGPGSATQNTELINVAAGYSGGDPTISNMPMQQEAELYERNLAQIATLRRECHLLLSRFSSLGLINDLDRAIRCENLATSLMPDGHNDKPAYLNNLAALYMTRFKRLGEITDINKAIDLQATAVNLTPGNNHSIRSRLNNLAVSYKMRFSRLGELSDIHQAIDYLNRVIALTPDDHPDMPKRLNNLGDAYKSLFERSGEAEDIEQAVNFLSIAVTLTPDDQAIKPARLTNLGDSYRCRYESLGALADIDDALGYLDRAIALSSNRDPEDKLDLFNSLGNSHTRRFERLGELEDIHKAIEYHSQVVELTAQDNSSMPGRQNNLGLSYFCRFERLGDLTDINKSIEHLMQAASLIPDDHTDTPATLSNLATAYQTRFERLNKLEDLTQAIEWASIAVAIIPDSHKNKPTLLSTLAGSRLRRYEYFGTLSDIDQAIEAQTQALNLTAGGDPNASGWFNNLGRSYRHRFDHLADLRDLEQAIECAHKAVKLSPTRHPNLPILLFNLSDSYRSRFERRGELPDIDKSIKYSNEAIALAPEDHATRPGWLSHLGATYRIRFQQLFEVADINKAIHYQSQAATLTLDNDASMSKHLVNLGTSYWFRFDKLGHLPDINKAIECLSQGLELTPNDHSNHPEWLSLLGLAYRDRFTYLAEHPDIDKAIQYGSRAVELMDHTHVGASSLLNNLGAIYLSRFQRLSQIQDIDQAIDFINQAVARTPKDDAAMAGRLSNLALVYGHRLQILNRPQDLNNFIDYSRQSAQYENGNPGTQFRASRQWAKYAPDSVSRQEGYKRAMELLPQVVWLGTTIEQRYERMSEMQNFATEAASCAISLGEYEQALEWLEEGRSIVWNQILRLRTPLEELSAIDPALAKRFEEVSRELDIAGSQSSPPSLEVHAVSNWEMTVQRHHTLAREWAHMLEQARLHPGLINFMRPRKATELLLNAKSSPVVVLNVHTSRCDALILRPDNDNISHVPLVNLSYERVVELRGQLNSMMTGRSLRAGGFQRARANREPAFQNVFASLCSEVALPVLNFLGYTRKLPVDSLPRITWCTTGPLSFMPLHAAGFYDGVHPNVFDLVVSSYAPTLSALLVSPPPKSSSISGILAIGQSHTKGLGDLPYTVHELATIEKSARVTRYLQLDGENATVDAVLDAMEEYSWVHMACHATQQPEDATQSAFHLHDGDLMLSTITKKQFKNKGLAFLSACQTAAGDENLPDEAVHLAAGMLISGYPSVIATMWSIYDEDGPEVAQGVYADLLGGREMDCTAAARALHKAVGHLRESVGQDAFRRWVPFIHIGL